VLVIFIEPFKVKLCKNSISRFLALICTFFIISCCTTRPHNNQELSTIKEELILKKVKQSVVKINSATSIRIKNIVTASITVSETDLHFASGSIIEQTKIGTLILTAGHVCSINDKQVLFHFPYFKKKYFDIQYFIKFIVFDSNGQSHPAVILAINRETDVCILLADKIN